MDDNFSTKRQNIRTLSLVIFTLIYLLTGAAVFDTLESSTEDRNRDRLLRQISLFRRSVNMSEPEFESLYRHMIKKGIHKKDVQWDFLGSFYFCTLALSLIGYGHSTPSTHMGKAVCIIYSLCGIPISLIMFQSVGERLNGFLRYLMQKVKSSQALCGGPLRFKTKDVSNKDLIVVEFVLTVVLVLSASYVFSSFEGWSYFDSLYYSFITLTTIGFGDFVPLQKNNYLKRYPLYVMFTIFFIMTGLIILASSTNLLVLYLVNINSEENLRKRMRLKQKKQEQLQKMLIGDVISSVNKQDVVTYMDEMPNLAALTEDLSVCSCDDITACYRSYATKVRSDALLYACELRETKCHSVLLGSSARRQRAAATANAKRHNRFSVLRRPNKQIGHLTRHKDKSDYLLTFMDKTQVAIMRLANESDFITAKRISRRCSV